MAERIQSTTEYPQRRKQFESSERSSSRKDRRMAWAIAWRIASVIVVMYAAFSASYWLMSRFFVWIGYPATPYLTQMTTLTLSMCILILVGVVIGRVAAPRQRAFMQALIDAIRQMAKGDFNVRVDVDLVQEPGGDSHPLRQLVHSINDMAHELAQLEQMRQEFVSNVSHEIQSPLTSISGFVDALKDEDLETAKRMHYLSIVEAESKRLSRLSDNLLKLTSLESGYHPFHPESFRLDRQIRDVVLSLEPLWLKKNIHIELDLPNVTVTADKDLLNQVWVNLVSNAIKFTGDDGLIDISLVTVDSGVKIKVRDTGIGMGEEDRARVFERFYKADKARSGGESGSGLGLSIVKRIVDLHHGEVRVDSSIGVGTTFTVQLPMAPAIAE